MLADAARDDVDRVQEGVEAVREHLAHERRAADPVHHDEQLVERELAAAAAEHARHDLVHGAAEPVHDRGVGRTGFRCALREQPLAPRARLEHHVAARVERAVGPVKEVVVD